MHQAAIAVTRFGLGAGPDEIDAARSDPRGWVVDQLGRPPEFHPVAGLVTSQQAALILQNLRKTRKAAKRVDVVDPSAQVDPARLAEARKQFRRIYLDEVAARVRTAVATSTPVVERLVHFWSNHFTVAATKQITRPLAGAFEREAIRPHMLGRFQDLLVAAESHPGMITYLDNHTSFGPNSRAGRRRGRGLNENLAREVLELHTLGVDGGYTQADVTSFAKVLTGWTIAPKRFFPDQAGRFKFIDAVHEPGAHTVLGRRYAEAGIDQPMAVLADLARHPATARHIATKLARHFIADRPPQAAVDRIARTFTETDGDLKAVSAAVLAADEAWQADQRKLKSANEYVLSVLRGLQATDAEPDKVVGSLELMGQRPYAAPSPQGWPDEAAHWASPDGLMKRIDWARLVADRIGGRIEPSALLDRLLGPLAADATRTAVARAESATQGLALALATPEFMRR